MRWSPPGGPSTAMVVHRARTGRSCGPAPRGGPATAPRWRPRRRPSALPQARSRPRCHEVLAAWRAVLEPGILEPWDYRFATGAMNRRLDGLVTRGRLQAINNDHLRSLGADPTALGIGYDIEPRPGRPPIPTAFAIARDIAREAADGTWRAATPWVFATHAEGGLDNLEELLHESGHALHYAAIRARPALFDPPVADAGLDEAFADLLGWDVHEPAFQARHLGVAAGPREDRLGRYAG